VVAGRRFYAEDLAYIHSAGFSGFSRAAAPAILRLLHDAHIDTGLIVDLGCGAGALARVLSSTGYDVLGIDVSRNMLSIAGRAAPRARFTEGAASTVKLPACEAVIAMGEVVSYAPPGTRRRPSLRPIFARVARALRARGLFVFDLIVKGEDVMTYRTWHAGRDWAVLVDVSERRSAIERRITTFRAPHPGAAYRRHVEQHVVGVYARDDVVRELRAAGFSVSCIERYGAAVLPPRRLAFVARRH
jgi:SAM-dependent methyltransferase